MVPQHMDSKAVVLGLLVLLSAWRRGLAGLSDRTKEYYIPSTTCSTSSREIEAAVIYSRHSQYYPGCILKFKSDDDFITSKRFMVKFDQLSITDCGSTLRIYSSSRSTSFGDPLREFKCGDKNPGILYVSERYLTIRLDNDHSAQVNPNGYNFKIRVTVYKETSYCKGFKCRNGRCIDDDLRCDSIDNCFDNSDEAPERCNFIMDRSSIITTSIGTIVGTAIAIVVICIIVIIITVVCCQKRRTYHGSVLNTYSAATTSSTMNTYPVAPNVAYPQNPPAPMYPSPQYAPAQYPPAMAPPPAYPGGPYPPQQDAAYPPGVGYTAGSDQLKMPQPYH